VVSLAPAQETALLALAKEMGVPAAVIGTVGAAKGEVSITRGGNRYSWPVESLRETYYSAIPRRMAHVVEDR
jgi:hypothetical protein